MSKSRSRSWCLKVGGVGAGLKVGVNLCYSSCHELYYLGL